MSTKATFPVCELILFSEPPIGYNGKKKVYPLCGRPAFYKMSFAKSEPGFYCKEHGEAMAGNHTHLLTKIRP